MGAGRPPIFVSVEEFESKAEEYFKWIQGEFHMQGDEKIWDRYPEHPTITGLCLFLGFESRQSFHDYQERSEFSYAFKKARLRIEKNYEQALFSKNPAGPIFALKNMGWADRQEIDQTVRQINFKDAE